MTLSEKIKKHLPTPFITLALVAFIGYFLVYCFYAWRLFQFPFDYDQGEGFELMDTILFSQGEWPYRNNDHYPFYSSNYPPLFHVVIVPLVWLFGPQYWTGRLMSFLGTLITAVAISYAVQREGKRWWLSTISGLAYLASNYIYQVGPLFRQHLFMVMFETLAIVLLTVAIDREEATGRKHTRWLLGVMLLLLLAGYTKQLAYATVAATFLFWFLRDWKRAIKWAIPFAGVTGLIFLWINIATDGWWLINTVTANINPFIDGQAVALYRHWFGLHWLLAIVAGGYALYQFYFERLSAYSVWFVVAIANAYTAGKWGAGVSYFATAISASCILLGITFSRLFDVAEQKNPSGWLAPIVATVCAILLLFQADSLFHMPTHTPALQTVAQALGKPTESWIAPQTSCSEPRDAVPIPYVDSAGVSLVGIPPIPTDTEAGKEISQWILAGETPAFSEDAGFNFYVGREVVTNPTQLLNLYQNNAVDLTEMVQMLEEQAFDTIVLRAQFYPPPVLDAIGQNYETVELIQMYQFVYCIMHPKPPTVNE